MLVTEEIEKLIIERRSTDDIKKVAVMEGMIPLRSDGLRKVGVGHDRPRRDLPRRHLIAPAPHSRARSVRGRSISAPPEAAYRR